MADDPSQQNWLDTILATEMARDRQAQELTEFLAHGEDADYDVSVLASLLLTSINGGS